MAAQERLRAAGWSQRQVLNAPNALCVLRALSGPVVAALIMHEAYTSALALTAVSGATDWLDGFLARRWNQASWERAAVSSSRVATGCMSLSWQPCCPSLAALPGVQGLPAACRLAGSAVRSPVACLRAPQACYSWHALDLW